MIRKLKMLSLFALLTGFVSAANAGILIEPFLGYQFGKWKQTGSADYTGAAYGARLGYKHFLGPMIGLDYLTGKFTDKANDSADLTPSQSGVFVGFEFPILLRVYGTYIIDDQLKLSNSTGTGTFKGSSGVKLGVGFTALPLLSINLEYSTSTYDKVGSSAITGTKFKTEAYGLYVSIPFDI